MKLLEGSYAAMSIYYGTLKYITRYLTIKLALRARPAFSLLVRLLALDPKGAL